MSAHHKTWWGARYKSRGSHIYPRLGANPLHLEVPIYDMVAGTCANCGRGYVADEGYKIEIVRQYPNPHIKPAAGQLCPKCKPGESFRRVRRKVVAERQARVEIMPAWQAVAIAAFVVAAGVLVLVLTR